MPEDNDKSFRDRAVRQGEDALGKLAQDLLENPLVSGAIARAFGAREKAAQAQEVAFGALNLPSAADLERLTRRVRSVSQRLEGIEDAVDRLDERLASSGVAALEQSLRRIEEKVDALASASTSSSSASPSRGRAGGGGKPKGGGGKAKGSGAQGARDAG